MNTLKGLCITVLAACLTLLPEFASAAGGPVAPITIVSDTRNLVGLMKWWGDIYNESHVEFTVFTCILIPVIGVVLGLGADVFFRWLGVDLKKRSLAEH